MLGTGAYSLLGQAAHLLAFLLIFIGCFAALAESARASGGFVSSVMSGQSYATAELDWAASKKSEWCFSWLLERINIADLAENKDCFSSGGEFIDHALGKDQFGTISSSPFDLARPHGFSATPSIAFYRGQILGIFEVFKNWFFYKDFAFVSGSLPHIFCPKDGDRALSSYQIDNIASFYKHVGTQLRLCRVIGFFFKPPQIVGNDSEERGGSSGDKNARGIKEFRDLPEDSKRKIVMVAIWFPALLGWLAYLARNVERK